VVEEASTEEDLRCTLFRVGASLGLRCTLYQVGTSLEEDLHCTLFQVGTLRRTFPEVAEEGHPCYHSWDNGMEWHPAVHQNSDRAAVLTCVDKDKDHSEAAVPTAPRRHENRRLNRVVQDARSMREGVGSAPNCFLVPSLTTIPFPMDSRILALAAAAGYSNFHSVPTAYNDNGVLRHFSCVCTFQVAEGALPWAPYCRGFPLEFPGNSRLVAHCPDYWIAHRFLI
jgi:hypothetical protein